MESRIRKAVQTKEIACEKGPRNTALLHKTKTKTNSFLAESKWGQIVKDYVCQTKRHMMSTGISELSLR